MLEKMIDKNEEWLYLPLKKYDAATNMAIDEFLLNKAAAEQKKFIRFYEFEKPSVILAYSESLNDVKTNNLNGIDLTRRKSNGSVIYCDDNVLTYSIIAPDSFLKNPSYAHDHLSKKISKVLIDLEVKNISVGEHFSIRVDNEPIAGHGQRWIPTKALLYHGVMAIDQWNVDAIDRTIVLREKQINGKLLREYDLIKSLPFLRKYADVEKSEIIKKLLQEISEGNFSHYEISKSERDEIAILTENYKSEEWIEKSHNGRLKEGLGFCLITFISPEKFEEFI